MINRLKFSIDIKADKSTIWKALWDEQSYREWASVFFEGSYAVTDDWREGSTVQFLAPDQSGIYSIIRKHIPHELMHFEHIGTVVGGKEQAVDEETKKWSGATEIYRLSEGENANTLEVDIDVMDEHVAFMSEKLPEALEKIRLKCSGVNE